MKTRRAARCEVHDADLSLCLRCARNRRRHIRARRVIDHGEIQKRKKKASKKFRDAFGHTPLSLEENIPWRCSRLLIGTGAYGRLPVMDDVKREADERGVKLIVLPTAEALEVLQKHPRETNAVLHVTC